MIELEQVGIRFRRFLRRERTLGSVVKRQMRRLGLAARERLRTDASVGQATRWALRDVDLHINRGERVGIVGRNGAGKSTLLRVMMGIYRPTQGRITVDGRVHALLGLHSGFYPELTGVENIRLSGTMMGLSSRRLANLLPEIIAFSGLGDSIHEPVRTYSTGMLARLGFAVATAVSPDVLLIDELLGVGDGDFRRRCEARLDSQISTARVVCICSHNLQLINRQCERVVWLHEGRVVQDGPSGPTLEAYEQFLQGNLEVCLV